MPGRDKRGSFAFAHHTRSTQCCLCGHKPNDRTTLIPIGHERALQIYIKQKVLCNPERDQICTVPHPVPSGSPPIVPCAAEPTWASQISMGHVTTDKTIKTDTSNRIINNIAALFKSRILYDAVKKALPTEKEKKPKSHLELNHVKLEHCQHLTNLSKAEIYRISIFIVHRIRRTNRTVSDVLNRLNEQHANDLRLEELRGIQDFNIFRGNDRSYRPTDSDVYKVANAIYHFLIKSKSSRPSFELLGVWMNRCAKQFRRQFHRGRFLVWNYFVPFFVGFGHVSRDEILRKTSVHSEIISSITGRNLIALFDGTKVRQSRFAHYDTQYNTYDPSKKYNTRGYMGVVTTSGYIIDFIGGFCTNGKHGDSHVLNYILQNNVNGINEYLDTDDDILGVDGGFKFLWGKICYPMIMPSLNRSKPVPAFYINVSRLLTAVRWVNEAVYGILDQRFSVFSNKIHQKWKSYINSWHISLIAIHNYLNPEGAHIGDGQPSIYQNYLKYKVRTEFFSNQLQATVERLNALDENQKSPFEWLEVPESIAQRLLRTFQCVARLSDDDIKLFSGGNYGYQQRKKYIEHNRNGESVTFSIHTAQFRYEDWKNRDDQLQNTHPQIYRMQLGLRQQFVRNDKAASAQCNDKYIVLKIDGITSRHTRKNKPTKKYTVYFAVDRDGAKKLMADPDEDIDHSQLIEAEDQTQIYHYLSEIDRKDDSGDVQMENSNQNSNQNSNTNSTRNLRQNNSRYNLRSRSRARSRPIFRSANTYSLIRRLTCDDDDDSDDGSGTDSEEDEKDPTRTEMQERMIRKMFTPDSVGRIQYQLQGDGEIPPQIRYLRSLCTCSHGLRTVGVCAHRTAFLEFVRDVFTGQGEVVPNPNPESKRNGSILINIEEGHELKKRDLKV